MEPEIQNIEPKQTHPVFTVTTLSKYLALALFILLPFIGGYIGYVYAPSDAPVLESYAQLEQKQALPQQNTEDKIVQPVSFALSEGIYSFATKRRSDRYGDWDGGYLMKLAPNGREWATISKVGEEYIESFSILEDQVYYFQRNYDSDPTSGSTSIFAKTLTADDARVIASVPGLASSFVLTKEAVIVAVPKSRFCLDKGTNCELTLYRVAYTGEVEKIAEARGVNITAYAQDGTFITQGGYGDAGCMSYEHYVYTDDGTETDSLSGSFCEGDAYDVTYEEYDSTRESFVNGIMADHVFELDATSANSFQVGADGQLVARQISFAEEPEFIQPVTVYSSKE
jgi:hypothetical protein